MLLSYLGNAKKKYGVHHSILNIGRKCGTENLTIEKKMKKKERDREKKRIIAHSCGS